MKLNQEQYEKIRCCFPKQRKPAKIRNLDALNAVLYLEQFPEIMRKKEARPGIAGQGGLTPGKDDNEVMRFPDR